MSGRYAVALNPQQRLKAMTDWLFLDGITDVTEDPNMGYGAIAITALREGISAKNDEVRAHLRFRQSCLIDAACAAGITLYDPDRASSSLDPNYTVNPTEIFAANTRNVARARHVTFIDVVGSTGCGIELEKARRLGKFVYVFHDPNIRTGRMHPDRSFHLSLNDFAGNKNQLTALFAFVNEHDPCLGFDGRVPVALGVHRETGMLVNLEQAVQERWPELMYRYDPATRILPMGCLDTSPLFENRSNPALKDAACSQPFSPLAA